MSLTHSSLKKLTEYILRINETQKLLESIRQNFGKNTFFQIQTTFERFDKFRKAYLLPSDLSQFMIQNNISPTEDQLYVIFKDFDKNKQGFTTIDQFQQQILPKQNNQLHKQILRRKYYPSSFRLQQDLEFQISKYFEAKISIFNQFEKLRKELFFNPEFETIKAFSYFDQKRTNLICGKEDIDHFLRKNGKVCTIEELRRIYQALDFRRPGPITYERFEEHIQPFKTGYYPRYQNTLIERAHMKQIHRNNQISLSVLEKQRQQTLLKQQLLHQNYLRLKDSNWYIETALAHQAVEKQIYNEESYKNLRRSRQLIQEQQQLRRINELRNQQKLINQSRNISRLYRYY